MPQGERAAPPLKVPRTVTGDAPDGRGGNRTLTGTYELVHTSRHPSLTRAMIPEVQVFAQVAAISVGIIAAACGISVATYRSVKRIDRTNLAPSAELQGQMEQLQQSVDSIAVEVERIAEAQRYMARLESERDARQALPLQS